MSFDTTGYLLIGAMFVVLIGVLLYLRPPGWRVFSGVELCFIMLALSGCVTSGTFVSFLPAEGICLLIATICFLVAMALRTQADESGKILKPPLATPQFRWLAVAYLAALARLMLNPFLPHMFT